MPPGYLYLAPINRHRAPLSLRRRHENRSLTGNHVSWPDPQMMLCEEPCLGLPGVCQESTVDTAFKGSFVLLICFDFDASPLGKGALPHSHS